MATTTKPAIGELLHRINEGAMDSKTPLGDVMRLCLRLGSLLGNKELSDWAKAEGRGYISKTSLPDYRVFETHVQGTFLGPFGSSLQNVSIPRFVIDESHRDSLFTVYMKQPVGELEQLARGREDTNRITIPWSGDTILYYQQKEIYQGYALNAAWQVLTTTIIAGVLEDIRTKVIEFVLAIEKELDIDIMNYDSNKKPLEASAQEKVGQIYNMTIHGGSNFAFGNSGTTNQQAIQVQPGDLKGLKERLAQLGVTEDLLDELDTALAKDADSEEPSDAHVQHWLKRLMIKASQGTIQLAGAAATTVVMTEVRRFLGLPPV